MTKEEIVLAAATDVVRVMEPQLQKQDQEEFIKFFSKKASEILEEKGRVFLGVGPCVAKSDALFTQDMIAIMQFVEENTKKKYSFRKGQLLIYFNKKEGTGIWEDD